MIHPPYTDEEAAEARTWVCKYGPPNSWTAGNGTAARMIGRLLKERERLLGSWVQVSERLPPQGERVMFLVDRADYRAVYVGEWFPPTQSWLCQNGETGWAAAFVSHWMPVPDFPVNTK